VGYGDEEMRAHGLSFAGWSTEATFQRVVPRVVLLHNITVFAVFYTARIPYAKPQPCSVTFTLGDEPPVTLNVNASSVIRLQGFQPVHSVNRRRSNWQVVSWSDSEQFLVEASHKDYPFHRIVMQDTNLFPVWNRVLSSSIFHPDCEFNPFNNWENPWNPDSTLNPWNAANPFGVFAEDNPFDQTSDDCPYNC